MLTRILISLIPIVTISLFVIIVERRKLKNMNLNNMLNVVLCGFLSILFTGILDMVLEFPMALVYALINKIIPNMLSMTFLLVFIDKFFMAGLPEELSKWTSIKISKPKTPYKILIHSIFVALFFMTWENYAYMNDHSSDFLGIYRVFMPIHIACQLIMALLLIKSKEKKDEGKKKYSIFLQLLSVLIPILLHTIYNTYTNLTKWELLINGVNILPMVIIFGMCTYIATFIAILKVKQKYPDKETNPNKGKLSKKKLILLIVISLLGIILFMDHEMSTKINETLAIESQNIDITVNCICQVKNGPLYN